MSWDIVFDTLRGINIVLAVVGLIMLWCSWMKYQRWYSYKMRIFLLAMSLWLLTAIVSSTENILQDNEGGYRTVLITLALCYQLWGLSVPNTPKSLKGE